MSEKIPNAIPTGNGEAVYMKEARAGASCDFCALPTDGLVARFSAAVRDGGVNVCVPCVQRVVADLKQGKR